MAEFIKINKLAMEVEPEWSKEETGQLLDLQKQLEKDWNAIYKFIPQRTNLSINTHFYNTLRYAACKYSHEVN